MLLYFLCPLKLSFLLQSLKRNLQKQRRNSFRECILPGLTMLSFLHLVFCTRVRKKYLEVNEQSHQVQVSLFTLHLTVAMTSLIKPALSGKQSYSTQLKHQLTFACLY